jgi:hypothetical protein
MRLRLSMFALFMLLACNEPPTFTGPSPVTTTVPPSCDGELVNGECRPPRVDQSFSVDAYRGIIAFGLGHPEQNEEDVLRFVNAAMGRGWNTFQICSETEFWNGPGYPTKPRDPERLYWILDTIARVPGAQVALIGNCTLKRQIPLGEQIHAQRQVPAVSAQQIEAWHQQVARTARQFRNVAIFTHNEFDNCRGRGDWGGRPEYCAGKEEVKRHIQNYRAAGIAVVTADDSFSWPRPGDPPSLTYGFRLTNIGARPASFHPDREKAGQPWDPSPHMLRELGRYNGTYILSETVAYNGSGTRCDGLRTCDQGRIDRYIANCAAEPTCRFTFHCAGDGGGDCLAGEVPAWIPEAR